MPITRLPLRTHRCGPGAGAGRDIGCTGTTGGDPAPSEPLQVDLDFRLGCCVTAGKPPLYSPRPGRAFPPGAGGRTPSPPAGRQGPARPLSTRGPRTKGGQGRDLPPKTHRNGNGRVRTRLLAATAEHHAEAHTAEMPFLTVWRLQVQVEALAGPFLRACAPGVSECPFAPGRQSDYQGSS